ncbi:prolyl oligopeptidase family serine peptidase [Solimonas soli]|uniref:prolyl oligopeptidase family serine peptidase n=1 Tax=Solimonas soli TaxID=413479 RepID=UPI0004849C8F|nr:prolyl oligopeptidase family serine peptidase [Solimonas soli]
MLITVGAAAALDPPKAAVQPVTDDYFGVRITDSYRWLEDQKSAQSQAWMKGQNDYTRTLLDSMPGRTAFSADMQRYLDAEPYSIKDVRLAGDRIFYRKRARGVSQETLCVRPAGGGAERALLDLNTLSKPGRHVSMDGYEPNQDGSVVAVTLSEGGEELGTGRFIDAVTGRQLPDALPRVMGTGAFDSDGKSYYYLALQDLPPDASPLEKFRRPRARLHRLGSDDAKDAVLLAQGSTPLIEVPDYHLPFVFSAPDAPYLVAYVLPGVDPDLAIYLAPKKGGARPKWRRAATLDDRVTDAWLHGDDLYVVSFAGAPNGKLLRLDARDPDFARAEVIVPPGDLVLTSGTGLGTEVLHGGADALYLRVVSNGEGAALRVAYGAKPSVTRVAIPDGMQVDTIIASSSVPGALLRLNSWIRPGDFYRYDTGSGNVVATGLIEKNSVDPLDHVVEEVTVAAKDGTPVPLSIIRRKDARLDGSAPTAMIGYGAYGDAWTPSYARRVNAWIERGGILAVAHVRGGGEKGEAWHMGGYKLSKHNTWEDFIACAHWLIDHRYTSSAKLGIWSQSAGGILIGRTITTEPGLVAAAVDGVPLSDSLRFETGANGPANIPEFGSVTTQQGFDALYLMGAYYHVQPGVKYPYVMVTAGANDPRVDAWQGAKMAAALQAATGSGKPVLLRVNFDGGHFADTSAQENSDWTDIFTFFLWAFGDPQFRPTAH